MHSFREITSDDVGKAIFHAFGRKWLTSGFIGQILPQDVGKRVYKINNILQVENDEQLNARKSKNMTDIPKEAISTKDARKFEMDRLQANIPKGAIEAAAKMADQHGCNTSNVLCQTLAAAIRALKKE